MQQPVHNKEYIFSIKVTLLAIVPRTHTRIAFASIIVAVDCILSLPKQRKRNVDNEKGKVTRLP